LHARTVGYLCAPCPTHPAHRCPPSRLLSALRLFPTACGIPLSVLVGTVGLRLALVVVAVPVASVAISGIPDVRVGALVPPYACACAAPHLLSRLEPRRIGGIGVTLGGSLLPFGSPDRTLIAPCRHPGCRGGTLLLRAPCNDIYA
jgi:hypothetical protein